MDQVASGRFLCEEFAAIKRANNGGLPDNYWGDLEKFLKEMKKTLSSKSQSVNALGVEDDKQSEFTESDVSDEEGASPEPLVTSFQPVLKGAKAETVAELKPFALGIVEVVGILEAFEHRVIGLIQRPSRYSRDFFPRRLRSIACPDARGRCHAIA